MNEIKTVGNRKPATAEERLAEVFKMRRFVEQVQKRPRPRGMVFKAKTWEEKEQFEKQLRLG